MASATFIWAKILTYIEQHHTEALVSTWFDDVDVVELRDNTLVLFTPNPFRKPILETQCIPYITEAMLAVGQQQIQVEILGEAELKEYQNRSKQGGELDAIQKEFTFENFVVGPSNRFAHAAAKAVADRPAESYNPLLIYGESGLGKTHLLYAIAREIHNTHPDWKIIYVRGDAFTNELITSIQKRENEAFRAKYRSADVFLMDDVQFIAGRDSTQEEMFHTFNALYEEKKQIVFTSDRPPKEMLRLEDRLKTRFEWGLLADIVPPDYETRVAIIKNKAIRMGIELPEEVLTYVAENITSNVRQIEGTVNKMLAYRDLMNSDINISTVIRVVRDILKDTSDILPTAEVIIEEVGKFYDIEESALRGHGRTKETNKARQIAIFLTRQLTKLSLAEIGKEFGDRDHSTILHSISRIEKLCKEDPETEEIVKDIKANINARYG